MKIKKGRFKALMLIGGALLVVGTMNIVGYLVLVHNQTQMKQQILFEVREKTNEMKFKFDEMEYLLREDLDEN